MEKPRNGKTSKNYEVEYSSAFERKYSKLDSTIAKRVDKTIEKLSANPFIGDKMREKRFRNLYKYRVGKHRLFYRINVEKSICYLTNFVSRDKAYR